MHDWSPALDVLCCFVDGSYIDSQTSWAVAYIGWQQGWAGIRHGLVFDQRHSRSAHEGELFAQFVAYATLPAEDVPGAVCFDAQAAEAVA